MNNQLRKPSWEYYEQRVAQAFMDWNSSYHLEQVFCLVCLKYFRNVYGNKQAPDACRFCGSANFCLPDGLIQPPHTPLSNNYPVLVFVNGSIHQKKRIIQKDKNQAAQLKALGIHFIVINNDEVANMTVTSLRAWAYGWLNAHKDGRCDDMIKGEKEYSFL